MQRQGADAGRERLGGTGRTMRQLVESTGSVSSRLAATRDTPAIVLLGKEGPAVEARAFAPGAND